MKTINGRYAKYQFIDMLDKINRATNIAHTQKTPPINP
jgi:UDP-galactopyranose mutase